jgi:hypothetical protein
VHSKERLVIDQLLLIRQMCIEPQANGQGPRRLFNRKMAAVAKMSESDREAFWRDVRVRSVQGEIPWPRHAAAGPSSSSKDFESERYVAQAVDPSGLVIPVATKRVPVAAVAVGSKTGRPEDDEDALNKKRLRK